MMFRRTTKRVLNATKNTPADVTYSGLGYFTGWQIGKSRNVYRLGPLREEQKEEEVVPDEIIIGFEDYLVEPISQSANNVIQAGWSGGVNTYFTNDSTDNETIVNTRAFEGSQSWFTGNSQLYGSPGIGSPFTPALRLETEAADETSFNTSLRGKTFCSIFYVYADSTDGTNDGSLLKIYNGSYNGDDRTGFNINITKGASLTATSYTYDINTNAFTEVPLGTLAYDTWHKFEVFITYAADGDPENDVFKYIVNDGTPDYILSWPNVWRKDNSFTPVYGTRLAFATGTDPESGWYIDNISIKDPPTPQTVPGSYTMPTGNVATPVINGNGPEI